MLSSQDSVTEDDLKKEIPQTSYRKSAYRWLQASHSLSEETSSRHLMHGPVPTDLKMKKALRGFLSERHSEYCRVMDEEQYSRLYLSDPNYLVFDQIFPGEREKVELFDLLYLGEDGKLYLYAIKEGFNNSTGIACTQIRVAMRNIQAALLSKDKKLLYNLYEKGVKTAATSDFRVQLKKRLQSMTPDEFVGLFIDRKIIFVYAFLDTNDTDRRLENELGLLQAVTTQELKEAKIKGAQKVLKALEKAGYLDKTAKLTDKFLRDKKKDFEGVMNVPGLHEVLMRRVSLFDSMIAKLEIIKLFDDFKGTNFELQIQQLDRPGEVATHFNYSTLGDVPEVTFLYSGKVTCGKITYSFSRAPKTLEDLFSELLGQKDPYSAQLVLGNLREEEDFPNTNQEVTEETLIAAAATLKKTLVIIDESNPPAALDSPDIVIIKSGEVYYPSREAAIPVYDTSATLQTELDLYNPEVVSSSVSLVNLYNDCFLNATLQVLIQTNFHVTLLQKPNDAFPISRALQAFALQYECTPSRLVTNYLRAHLSVSMGEQEDPAQVLGEMLLAFDLQGELPIFQVETIPHTVNGVELEEIPDQCSTLEELADQEQTLSIISLPIPKKGAAFQECWKAFENCENKEPITYLDDEVAYQSGSYTQTFTLQNAPPFLFVQLLRYTNDNKKIDAPLNIEQAVELEDEEYEVVAAINHDGATPTSGHYTSLVKTDDQWTHFDDETITEMKTPDAQSQLNLAYILVLRRKD
ncbi:MAG: hypothetical protein KFB93_02555 [Simkaniaceae bacterium]|nr:MAG: hypothetical protein KFB93_02555 [Simkaniaceae bacterium]